MTAPAMETLAGLPGFRATGKNQWEARCPGHEDRKASLSIGTGNDGKLLLHCHAGCDLARILEAARIESKDLFASNGNGHKATGERPTTDWKGRAVAGWHPYVDEAGNPLYWKARINFTDAEGKPAKDFLFWAKGSWGVKDKGIRRIPYRLDRVTKADEVLILEGESDVAAAEELGFTATTLDNGANADPQIFVKYLKPQQRVVLIGDADRPGREYREKVLSALCVRVTSLKSIDLPDMPEGEKDLRGWLASRRADLTGAAEQLAVAIEAASEWKPPAKPSIVHWAHEALEPQPGKDWIVKDLIGAGDVATLIGDAGSKKTWSALDLAVCVALGENWLGRHVYRSRVLIVDEESGERRLKTRLGDCMRAHEAGPDLPIAFTTLAGITLATDEGAERLAGIAREVEARFVVMDALQDFTLGLDENSGQELAPVIHRLKTIAESLQCAVWLLHHLNKNGGYRGHSSIKGLVDLMIKCESDTAASLIQFTAEKTRDSLVTPFAATAHFELGKFWLSDADPRNTEERFSRSQRYVLDFLEAQPDKTATMTVIQQKADRCSADAARRAVYGLAEAGRIARVDAGGRGIPATYRLKDELL